MLVSSACAVGAPMPPVLAGSASEDDHAAVAVAIATYKSFGRLVYKHLAGAP